MQKMHALILIKRRDTTNFNDQSVYQKTKRTTQSKLTIRHTKIQRMEEISIDDEYDDGSDEGVNGFEFVNNSSSSQPNPRKTKQNRLNNSINSIHSQFPLTQLRTNFMM